MSALSVKKPYTVIVAVLLVVILGIVSLFNMQTDLIPSFNLPYAIVITTYPGASPEQVETAVTDVIEQSLASVSRLQEISSTSNENYSMVTLQFTDETNLDYAAVEIRENLDRIAGYLPENAGDPTIMKINPNIIPLMVASADMDGADRVETTNIVNDKVLPALKSVEGVASVSATGLVERSVNVTVSQEKIDSINKRILRKVDSQLADAQDELDNAQSEIDNGYDELSSQRRTRMNAVSSAEKALSKGRTQMKNAKKELDANSAKVDSALEQAQAGLDEINNNLPQLQAAKLMADENADALHEALVRAKEAVDSAEEPSAELLNALDEAQKLYDAAQERRNELGSSVEQLTAQKAELEATITALKDSKAEIEKGYEQYRAGESKLKQQEAQLASGKKQLTSALDSAKKKLDSAQSELDDAMEEFEAKRDEAIKKADMEGVITAELVTSLINAQNISYPAGYVQDGDESYVVRVGDKIESEQALRQMPLLSLDELEMDIVLNDVADVEITDNTDDTVTKVNGNEAILITMQKQNEYSTAEVAKGVRAKMEQLTSENKGLNMTALMDQGVYVDIIIRSVFQNLIYGAILAIIILILFLRDWKITFVIALSIPISLIFAIVLMYFSGVTLNLISMSGLALAVGMLVDNSIVVIENIYRMRQEGKSARDAAIYGAKQVAGAIISSTLTTCAVFLPIVFTKGITKQLFTDMGLTITYALLASLIIALSFVPMACSGALNRSEPKQHRLFDKFCDWYGRVLSWCLRVKWVPLTLALSLFAVSIIGAMNMGTQFFPQMQGDQMAVTLKMDDEMKFEEQAELAVNAAERIRGVDGVTAVGLSMTDSSGGGLSSSAAMVVSFATRVRGSGTSLYVLLDPDRSRGFYEIKDDILNRLSDIGCEVSVSGQSMDISMLTGSGVSISIFGRDLDKLQEAAKDLAGKISKIEGTKDVSDGFEQPAKEIRVTVDKQKALKNGLTTGEIYAQLADYLKAKSSVATLTFDDEDYPVMVTSELDDEIDLEYIRWCYLTTRDGKDVRIGTVADIDTADGYTKIDHESQQRYVTVTAGIADGYNVGKVSSEINRLLEGYRPPNGMTVKADGENEAIVEALQNILLMLAMAVAFVYLIMAAQFQSLKMPFIVLFTLPLAFTGAWIALTIAGFDLSVIAAVGMVLLVGVVVNNGIVFVDYVNQLREGGMKKRDALVLTGKTRLRPILMTALTTIISMITMVIGVGSGTEMVQPMAVTVLGGLIYATMLTLIIVPVIYDLFNKENYKRTGIFAGLVRGSTDKNFRMNADGTSTILDGGRTGQAPIESIGQAEHAPVGGARDHAAEYDADEIRNDISSGRNEELSFRLDDMNGDENNDGQQ